MRERGGTYASIAAANAAANVTVKARRRGGAAEEERAIGGRRRGRRQSSGWLDSMSATACVAPMTVAAAQVRALTLKSGFRPEACRLPRSKAAQKVKYPSHSTMWPMCSSSMCRQERRGGGVRAASGGDISVTRACAASAAVWMPRPKMKTHLGGEGGGGGVRKWQ
jgi:hypothetical protein